MGGAGDGGGGAALAAARRGCRVLLLVMNLDTVAQMSCNPAIGGVAKGQIVREIDALGGAMGRVIDRTMIQFRMLNRSKGPAVWSPRAQADKRAYQDTMRLVVERQPGLHLVQDTAEEVLVKGGRVTGVRCQTGLTYHAPAVVLTTGTFLRGLCTIGQTQFEGGRAGETAARGLGGSLEELGFELGRLKTGTPARVNARSIDYDAVDEQPGDAVVDPFSFVNRMDHPEDFEGLGRLSCHITETNEHTHRIIRDNLDRAPLYTGAIDSVGPRYCPSIETKIVRFPDRAAHHVFLEPEGIDNDEVYINGMSTSLPVDVQLQMYRSVRGLEQCEILRWAYAIEYDYVPPTQLTRTLETRLVEGLFHAGQINGTSGYEEAAGQGLVAGANAAATVLGEPPLVLGREQAYIGVMIDDLVTLGVDEPYRMFTSRAEFRLLLRQDNAEDRLVPVARRHGLVDDELWRRFEAGRDRIERAGHWLAHHGTEQQTCLARLKRPEVSYRDLADQYDALQGIGLNRYEAHRLQTEVKYAGYIDRQREQVEKMAEMEQVLIPDTLDYDTLEHLRAETKEQLKKYRPATLGQAGRLRGVTPADVMVLALALKHGRHG